MNRFLIAMIMVGCLAMPTAAQGTVAPGATMAMATGWSHAASEATAVREATASIRRTVPHPKLLVVYTTVGYDVRRILAGVHARMPGARVFGVTSCRRVVTETGIHERGRKGVVGMMGLDGADLRVGTAVAPIARAAEAAAVTRAVLARAIAQAGRQPNERPTMILLGSTPGFEERAIEGIQSVLGKGVPIYGGSAADDDISGKWSAMAGQQAVPSGVSLAVLYARQPVGSSFASGYLGSHRAGTVTAAKGRTLLTIDRRPAGEVYNSWAQNGFAQPMKTGGSILAASAFTPLAKAVVTKTGFKRFVSLHPARIDPVTKGIELFGEPNVGEAIYFLKGNAGSFLHRVATVTRRSLVDGRIKRPDVVGGLHIYCAGAMLAVENRIGEIVPRIDHELGGKPFLGAFTFGEQGSFSGDGSFHGNLMTSTVVFGRR